MSLTDDVSHARAELERYCPGHEEWDVALDNLAEALYDRFLNEEEIDDVNEAIAMYRAALALRPAESHERPCSLHGLAFGLSCRYDNTGILADLEEAVALGRAALERCPPGHPCRETTLSHLAHNLWKRFQEQAAICDLEDAIEFYRAALELLPSGLPDRFPLLHHLALCLSSRYDNRGVVADLEEAITLRRAALELHPPGHPNRHAALFALACDLWTRFQKQATMHDLEEAIELHCAALLLRPSGHPDRYLSLHSLALYLSNKYNNLGVTADLEEAVAFGRAALALCPLGHPGRGICLYNLAHYLWERFWERAAICDLQDAIEFYRAALELLPPAHPDQSSMFHHLALRLSSRYDNHGEVADLEEAGALERAALKLCPPGHPGRGEILGNLASLLWRRFHKQAAMCDLEEGIRLRREALDLCPSADPHRSCLLSSLALYLRDRYDAQEVVADLEEAITLGHVVLELRPPGHPCRHKALGTLADYLRRRFQERATMHDLEEAIQLSREALEQCPSGHPDRPWTLNELAACLTERFNRQKTTADFEEVMMLRHLLLDLHPMGHLDRRKYLYDLAVPLWASFLRHFALLSSVEAQSLCQTFSRAHSTDHSVLTSSLHNLSLCLRHSVLQQAATVDLADAIRLATTVLQLRLPNRATTLIRPATPFVHQRAQALALVERLDEFAILGRVVDYLHILANFLRDRFCSHHDITDLNEAIMVLQQVNRLRPARHPARASSLHALALCLVDRFRENATRADLDKAIELQQAATDLLTPGDPGYDLLLEHLTTYLRMKIRSPMGMITSGTSGIERAGVEQLIWHVAFDALKNAPTRLLHTRTGKLCNRDVQVSHFVISQQYHRLLSSVTACDPYIDFECIRAAILLYFKFVTLSHHRGGGEPSLRDVKGSSIYDVAVVPKAGLRKLQGFCLVACRRGYLWAWSDTCCINKESSAELQEAIGSMFAWYRRSALTIVYLADILEHDSLVSSKWFQRGWTLQELLAPRTVLFYTQNWSLYKNLESPNHKSDSIVLEELESATGIASRFLADFSPGMDDARSRLQWASSRLTTRPEDTAYSLFGIFGLHLPVLYGEPPEEALGRLLAEIIAQSGEISVLDWVGEASHFHSCFPAHIASYQRLPLPPSPQPDAEELALTTGQEATSNRALRKLYGSLAKSSLPRFINRRLILPCLAYRVTAIQVKKSGSHVKYKFEASGLRPLEITLPRELDNVGTSPGVLQLVRPWNSKLLGPSARLDPTAAQQLLSTLERPFNALLLVELPHNEYKRIVSSTFIIAQPVDCTSILQSKVRTFTIV